VSRETMRLAQAGFDLKVTAQVLECLLRDGFDRQLGARPLRQTVERHLQDAVVSSLFRHGAASSHLAVDSGIQRVIIRSPAQS
jgi:ATP-dependent Clp protease ATP-binding subunit ClpA